MEDDELSMRMLVELWAVAARTRHGVEQSADGKSKCSAKQFATLQIIETSEENLTSSDLARVMDCSRANASLIVRDLVARGWLKTSPAFGDARAAIVRLTEAGWDVYDDHRWARLRSSSWHMRVLDADDRERLVAICKKLAAGADGSWEWDLRGVSAR